MARLFEKRLEEIVRSAVPRDAEVYLEREDGDACIYAEWLQASGQPSRIRIVLTRKDFAAYVAGGEQYRDRVNERLLLTAVELMQFAAGYLATGGRGDDLPAIRAL